MLKGILIDFDNTIVNSEESRLISLNYVLKRYKFEISNEMWEKDFKHLNSRKVLSIVSQENNFEFDIEEMYQESHKFREDYIQKNGMTFVDGFLDFYNYLKSNEIKFLICSGGKKSHIKQNLELMNLHIDYIGIEDFIEPKPSSACYRMGLDKLGLLKEEVIVIDDSLSGIKAALRLDLRVIAVNSNIDLEDKNLILKVKDYNELNFAKLLEL